MAHLIRVIKQLTKSPHNGICQLCQKTRYLCDSTGSPYQDDDYIPGRVKRRLERRNRTENVFDNPPPTSNSDEVQFSPRQSTSERLLQSELQESVIGTSKEIDFPSDVAQLKNAMLHQNSTKTESRRKNSTDPRSTSVVLFPGQGSQYVGMGKNLLKYPGVSDIYAEASEYLGYDLLSLCLTGPREKLDMTLYCQPAVFVTSLAALEKLKEEHPEAVNSCVATAGYSIGEYTALVFSKCLSFSSALELVALRAKVMQESSEMVAGGMMSVYVNRETRERTAMVAAKEYCRKKLKMEEPVCKVANYACTNVKVIAGNEEALDFIEHFGKEFGIHRSKRLPVSGAFHTELMKLGRSFSSFKSLVERTDFEKPQMTVYCNVTGSKLPYACHRIRATMIQQVTKPVLWEQTMHEIYKRSPDVAYPNTFEVGPGKQLGIFLKSCNGKAFKQYSSISG